MEVSEICPRPPSQFALSNPGVSTVLVAYSDIDHLEKSVQYASRGVLPSDALARLPEIWDGFVR